MSKEKSIENQNKKSRFFDKISNVLGILLSVTGLLIAIFYINSPKSNLEFTILTNTPLIDIKEDITKLNIIYDSINFIKEEKNISITIIEVKNNGNKNITSNDYDFNIPFGIKIKNATLIKAPEIIQSSDTKYFKNIISKSTENTILFEKKILDSKEFFQLKIYSIHDKRVKPNITYLGKISGQKSIEIIDIESKSQEKNNEDLNQLISFLSTALITILSLLTLSLYKNNNIRFKVNNLLSNKNQELKQEIKNLEDKLKNKKNDKIITVFIFLYSHPKLPNNQ